MVELVMRLRVVPTYDGSVNDTVAACGTVGKAYLYCHGSYAPHYPVPAIPLQVKYDYVGCVNIDDVSDPDDPYVVYMWDSWAEYC